MKLAAALAAQPSRSRGRAHGESDSGPRGPRDIFQRLKALREDIRVVQLSLQLYTVVRDLLLDPGHLAVREGTPTLREL